MTVEPEGDDMAEPTYIKALKLYGAGEPTAADLKSAESELYNGPDRGAAVLMAALVERSVERLLKTQLRPETVGELFKYGAPLGDFGSMISMGFSLRLYGTDTRRELNIIRHLRNQFAHSKKPIRFRTPEVKACCDQLIYPDQPGVLIPINFLNKVSERRLAQAVDKTNPRTRFFISCNEIAQRIYFVRSGDPAAAINKLL